MCTESSECNSTRKGCGGQMCDGNQEVKAFAWESVTQGISVQGMAFYAQAILVLAKKIAGCEQGVPCTGTIYGIPPQSILTMLVTISGFSAALLMPFVGSIVDKTPYRRGVAAWTAVLLIISSAIKIMLSEETFTFCLIIMGVGPTFLLTHGVTVMSYLHELTDDEKKLGQYMGMFVALRSLASLFLMTFVFGLGMVLPLPEGGVENTVALAQLAQIVDVVLSSICFVPTFLHKGFKSRPAKSKIEPGTSLFGSAGRQLFRTLKKIYQTCPALKWFLISNILIGSVQSAASVIAISFMVDFLQMSVTQTTIAIFLYNVFQIFGAILFKVVSRRFCIFRALKIVILTLTISFIVGSIVMRGPEQISVMFCFIALWSTLLGWLLPNTRTIYVKIIPVGQEAEMMGLYLFFSNGFVWFPTLVATFLTGFGVSWSVVLGTLSVYTILALVTLTFMGSYASAKQHALDMSEENLSTGKVVEENSAEDALPKSEASGASQQHSSSTHSKGSSASMQEYNYSDVGQAQNSSVEVQYSVKMKRSMASQLRSVSTRTNDSSVMNTQNKASNNQNTIRSASINSDESSSTSTQMNQDINSYIFEDDEDGNIPELGQSFHEIARLGRF